MFLRRNGFHPFPPDFFYIFLSVRKSVGCSIETVEFVKMLDELNIESDEAEDGKVALEKCAIKMPDIIFAGSSERKPLNRAEVTLEFDNQDHQLKSDYDQISVTRVLYRDGTSAFYLNQKSCRLKDIVNLFMDSGLGRESFSIISQGRVEAIFNSKPEDRRNIIEEAAGVLKYKQQKKKAQSELDQTDDNLNRVADIVHELQAQVEPLKEQSSIAQDYLDQKAQFDQIHQQLLVVEIDQLAIDQASHQKTAESLAQTLATVEADNQQTNADLAANQATLTELEQTLEQKTSLLSEKEEAILHYIFERGSISTGKAAEVCGYKSRTSARKVIDEMAEKGYIVKTGKGASVRYSICGEKVVKK